MVMNHTDKQLTASINNLGKGQLTFWTLLSLHGVYTFVFFFFGIWFANEWDIHSFLILSLSVFITLIVTFTIRYIVKRARPNFLHTKYVPALKKYSFPSAHAAVSFALAASIAIVLLESGAGVLNLLVVIVLFVFATLISASRIMVGVHYLGDVLAGSILGSFIPFLVAYFL